MGRSNTHCLLGLCVYQLVLACVPLRGLRFVPTMRRWATRCVGVPSVLWTGCLRFIGVGMGRSLALLLIALGFSLLAMFFARDFNAALSMTCIGFLNVLLMRTWFVVANSVRSVHSICSFPIQCVIALLPCVLGIPVLMHLLFVPAALLQNDISGGMLLAVEAGNLLLLLVSVLGIYAWTKRMG